MSSPRDGRLDTDEPPPPVAPSPTPTARSAPLGPKAALLDLHGASGPGFAFFRPSAKPKPKPTPAPSPTPPPATSTSSPVSSPPEPPSIPSSKKPNQTELASPIHPSFSPPRSASPSLPVKSSMMSGGTSSTSQHPHSNTTDHSSSRPSSALAASHSTERQQTDNNNNNNNSALNEHPGLPPPIGSEASSRLIAWKAARAAANPIKKPVLQMRNDSVQAQSHYKALFTASSSTATVSRPRPLRRSDFHRYGTPLTTLDETPEEESVPTPATDPVLAPPPRIINDPVLGQRWAHSDAISEAAAERLAAAEARLLEFELGTPAQSPSPPSSPATTAGERSIGSMKLTQKSLESGSLSNEDQTPPPSEKVTSFRTTFIEAGIAAAAGPRLSASTPHLLPAKSYAGAQFDGFGIPSASLTRSTVSLAAFLPSDGESSSESDYDEPDPSILEAGAGGEADNDDDDDDDDDDEFAQDGFSFFRPSGKPAPKPKPKPKPKPSPISSPDRSPVVRFRTATPTGSTASLLTNSSNGSKPSSRNLNTLSKSLSTKSLHETALVRSGSLRSFKTLRPSSSTKSLNSTSSSSFMPRTSALKHLMKRNQLVAESPRSMASSDGRAATPSDFGGSSDGGSAITSLASSNASSVPSTAASSTKSKKPYVAKISWFRPAVKPSPAPVNHGNVSARSDTASIPSSRRMSVLSAAEQVSFNSLPFSSASESQSTGTSIGPSIATSIAGSRHSEGQTLYDDTSLQNLLSTYSPLAKAVNSYREVSDIGDLPEEVVLKSSAVMISSKWLSVAATVPPKPPPQGATSGVLSAPGIPRSLRKRAPAPLTIPPLKGLPAHASQTKANRVIPPRYVRPASAPPSLIDSPPVRATLTAVHGSAQRSPPHVPISRAMESESIRRTWKMVWTPPVSTDDDAISTAVFDHRRQVKERHAVTVIQAYWRRTRAQKHYRAFLVAKARAADAALVRTIRAWRQTVVASKHRKRSLMAKTFRALQSIVVSEDVESVVKAMASYRAVANTRAAFVTARKRRILLAWIQYTRDSKERVARLEKALVAGRKAGLRRVAKILFRVWHRWAASTIARREYQPQPHWDIQCKYWDHYVAKIEAATKLETYALKWGVTRSLKFVFNKLKKAAARRRAHKAAMARAVDQNNIFSMRTALGAWKEVAEAEFTRKAILANSFAEWREFRHVRRRWRLTARSLFLRCVRRRLRVALDAWKSHVYQVQLPLQLGFTAQLQSGSVTPLATAVALLWLPAPRVPSQATAALAWIRWRRWYVKRRSWQTFVSTVVAEEKRLRLKAAFSNWRLAIGKAAGSSSSSDDQLAAPPAVDTRSWTMPSGEFSPAIIVAIAGGVKEASRQAYAARAARAAHAASRSTDHPNGSVEVALADRASRARSTLEAMNIDLEDINSAHRIRRIAATTRQATRSLAVDRLQREARDAALLARGEAHQASAALSALQPDKWVSNSELLPQSLVLKEKSNLPWAALPRDAPSNSAAALSAKYSALMTAERLKAEADQDPSALLGATSALAWTPQHETAFEDAFGQDAMDAMRPELEELATWSIVRANESRHAAARELEGGSESSLTSDLDDDSDGSRSISAPTLMLPSGSNGNLPSLSPRPGISRGSSFGSQVGSADQEANAGAAKLKAAMAGLGLNPGTPSMFIGDPLERRTSRAMSTFSMYSGSTATDGLSQYTVDLGIVEEESSDEEEEPYLIYAGFSSLSEGTRSFYSLPVPWIEPGRLSTSPVGEEPRDSGVDPDSEMSGSGSRSGGQLSRSSSRSSRKLLTASSSSLLVRVPSASKLKKSASGAHVLGSPRLGSPRIGSPRSPRAAMLTRTMSKTELAASKESARSLLVSLKKSPSRVFATEASQSDLSSVEQNSLPSVLTPRSFAPTPRSTRGSSDSTDEGAPSTPPPVVGYNSLSPEEKRAFLARSFRLSEFTAFEARGTEVLQELAHAARTEPRRMLDPRFHGSKEAEEHLEPAEVLEAALVGSVTLEDADKVAPVPLSVPGRVVHSVPWQPQAAKVRAWIDERAVEKSWSTLSASQQNRRASSAFAGADLARRMASSGGLAALYQGHISQKSLQPGLFSGEEEAPVDVKKEYRHLLKDSDEESDGDGAEEDEEEDEMEGNEGLPGDEELNNHGGSMARTSSIALMGEGSMLRKSSKAALGVSNSSTRLRLRRKTKTTSSSTHLGGGVGTSGGGKSLAPPRSSGRRGSRRRSTSRPGDEERLSKAGSQDGSEAEVETVAAELVELEEGRKQKRVRRVSAVPAGRKLRTRKELEKAAETARQAAIQASMAAAAARTKKSGVVPAAIRASNKGKTKLRSSRSRKALAPASRSRLVRKEALHPTHASVDSDDDADDEGAEDLNSWLRLGHLGYVEKKMENSALWKNESRTALSKLLEQAAAASRSSGPEHLASGYSANMDSGPEPWRRRRASIFLPGEELLASRRNPSYMRRRSSISYPDGGSGPGEGLQPMMGGWNRRQSLSSNLSEAEDAARRFSALVASGPGFQDSDSEFEGPSSHERVSFSGASVAPPQEDLQRDVVYRDDVVNAALRAARRFSRGQERAQHQAKSPQTRARSASTARQGKSSDHLGWNTDTRPRSASAAPAPSSPSLGSAPSSARGSTPTSARRRSSIASAVLVERGGGGGRRVRGGSISDAWKARASSIETQESEDMAGGMPWTMLDVDGDKEMPRRTTSTPQGTLAPRKSLAQEHESVSISLQKSSSVALVGGVAPTERRRSSVAVSPDNLSLGVAGKVRTPVNSPRSTRSGPALGTIPSPGRVVDMSLMVAGVGTGPSPTLSSRRVPSSSPELLTRPVKRSGLTRAPSAVVGHNASWDPLASTEDGTEKSKKASQEGDVQGRRKSMRSLGLTLEEARARRRRAAHPPVRRITTVQRGVSALESAMLDPDDASALKGTRLNG